MEFSIRDLLLMTVIAALAAGCTGCSQRDDEIRYYPPGPEFQRSREADASNSPAPAPDLPKE